MEVPQNCTVHEYMYLVHLEVYLRCRTVWGGQYLGYNFDLVALE